MSGRALWSIASFLVVVVLLLASCGPAAPATTPTPTSTPVPTPTSTPVPTPTSTPVPTPTPAASAEKPKYGGTINLIQPLDITIFVPPGSTNDFMGHVYEQLTNVDWSRGPAGTGETSFGDFTGVYGVITWKDVAGSLAESFETPEIGVWILEIRQGVHFGLNPKSEASRLVNGREMTADDVVASLKFLATNPNALLFLSQPGLAKSLSVEKTGPWEVTVKTPIDPGIVYAWQMGGGGQQMIWPKEILEQYTKTNRWEDVVGTGPYMLTDFVSGSVATFIRNPNYWRKNPAGPGKGDQLPYPDGLKVLIVPDVSTRLASMRTGKADRIDEVLWEDAESLLKTGHNLQYKTFIPAPLAVGMRTDKADLPYKDLRVRQALMMATDFEALKNDLYGGKADIIVWPVAPSVGTKGFYIPLEQLPQSVQALYRYNPQRAKELLAEAGYPNGFKPKMIVLNQAVQTDAAATLKAMWAKAGIDLEIQPKESAVYASIGTLRSHDDMTLRALQDASPFGQRYQLQSIRSTGSTNPSFVNNPFGKDSVIEAAYQDVQKNIMVDYPKADQIIHDLIPYLLEQAYYVVLPSPRTYRIWQPWFKNYYGESHLKYFIAYPWIDQDLKEQMTGRR